MLHLSLRSSQPLPQELAAYPDNLPTRRVLFPCPNCSAGMLNAMNNLKAARDKTQEYYDNYHGNDPTVTYLELIGQEHATRHIYMPAFDALDALLGCRH